jgi:hypothetical protein
MPHPAHTPPYGVPYGMHAPYYPPPPPPGNGLGVAGFVTGLLGLLMFWIPFLGILLALLGVCMGGAGIAVGKKRGAGIGLAIAGLVCGLIGMIPAVMFIVAMHGAASAVRHL